MPKLVVFDLDFTLWDCGGTWCDCLSPPFKIVGGRVVDRNQSQVQLFPDVPAILDACDELEIPMALASRTEQPGWARQLIELLGIEHRFAYAEIYPSSKLRHFQALYAQSNIAYGHMLFFDDEVRNITECSRAGVNCVYVEHGITEALFRNGLSQVRSSD